MDAKENEVKEVYEKNLKAVDYAVIVQGGLELDSDMHRIPLTFFHEVLSSGRFKGSTLLEIGCGGQVHYVAVTSAFFPNIVMSDFVEDNCEELKRWLQGDSTLKQFLDIPAEVEGYGGDLEAGKRLLENRIRKSVKQVVRGDVLSDNFFLEEVKSEVAPPYDLITSSLCLEAAATDFQSFVRVLKRINKLLRPGGGLFLVGFLEGKTWRVKETDFNYAEISDREMREALKESGFGNIDMRIHDKLKFGYEHVGYYCLAAEKL